MRPLRIALALAFAAVPFRSALGSDDPVSLDVCARGLLAEDLKKTLIDKDAAVDALMAAYTTVARAPGDHTVVVHLFGGPGTGKTYVVRRFASDVLGDGDRSLFVSAHSFDSRYASTDDFFGTDPGVVATYPPETQGIFPKGTLPKFVDALGDRVGILEIDEAEKFGVSEPLIQVLEHGTLGANRSRPKVNLRPYRTGKLIVVMTWRDEASPWLDLGKERTHSVRLTATQDLVERLFLDGLGGHGAVTVDLAPAAGAKVCAASLDLNLSPRTMYDFGASVRDRIEKQGLDLVPGDKLYVKLRRADAPAAIELTVGATQKTATLPLRALLEDLCHRRFAGPNSRDCLLAASKY